MSDSVQPHRWQPTRLPSPWDSPGKNAGLGCHFLLQCMKVESESEVTQSCPTLRDPMDCSLPGSYIHGIFQASILEWGATAFSFTQYSGISFLESQQCSSTPPIPHSSDTKVRERSFLFPALEKEMATHSSVLAWRIPGTGEPGGLPSMGSHRVGHD